MARKERVRCANAGRVSFHLHQESGVSDQSLAFQSQKPDHFPAMRRRKGQSVESTDIRKVSELVHERRAERARNSEMLRENSEAAEAAVRTYRPEQRLRSVDDETQQLVQDARDIPRTWDRDSPLSACPPSADLPVRGHYLVVLGANLLLLVATITLPLLLNVELDLLLLLPCLAAAGAVILAIGSVRYLHKLGTLAWVGLGICVAELTAFFSIIGPLLK
jgi:hypothetical protein